LATCSVSEEPLCPKHELCSSCSFAVIVAGQGELARKVAGSIFVEADSQFKFNAHPLLAVAHVPDTLTQDKVTELFCIADDFCKFFDAMMEKYTIKEAKKRNYHRDSTLSKSEVMLIMILFHDSGYRCLKHFYLESVCKL